MGVRRRPATFTMRVNPILCDGFGHCAELAPDLVHLDEWGYPIIADSPIPLATRDAVDSARYAVRGCPRQALRLEYHRSPHPESTDQRPID